MCLENAEAMTYREARASLDRIKEDPLGRFDEAQKFKARRGWAALCYTSWDACRKSMLLPKETGMKFVRPKVEATIVHEQPVLKQPVRKERRKAVRRTHHEYMELARVLAANNGGKVPCNVELRELGYFGLYKDMKRFPDEYAAEGLEMDFKGSESQRVPRPSKQGQA